VAPTTTWRHANWRVGLLLRHSIRANIAFPDGHGEAYSIGRVCREWGITKMIMSNYAELDL
jgi:prepilin-type processing-associated H-X9-DG protein